MVRNTGDVEWRKGKTSVGLSLPHLGTVSCSLADTTICWFEALSALEDIQGSIAGE